MNIKWGINHIQNLKEFGKQEPKELFDLELTEDADNDYRPQALNWAKSLFEKQDKTPFEIFVTNENGKKTWTPVFSEDLKQKSNLYYEDCDIPVFICELLNDDIMEFIS